MTNAATSQNQATSPEADAGQGRSDAAFREAQRHSRRVRIVKVALPLLAVMLTAGFAGYSYLLSPAGVSIDIAATTFRDGKLVMANPKVNGFTKDNLPYEMTAARAIQDPAKTNLVALEEIDAKFPVSDANWALVETEAGVYDDRKQTLDITTPVTFKTTDGMIARLRSATIDIAASELKTTDPVKITQDGSVIEADTFSVHEGGKVFVFEKRVRMTIEPRKDPATVSATSSGNTGN